MPAVKNVKYTIGGPESTPGVAVARTHVIPIRGKGGLDKSAERGEDPAITGVNMSVGEHFLSDDVGGPIPLAIRATPGIGKILKSLLGTESTPAQIGACIRLIYKGSEKSCKIISNTTTDTLKSYVGVKGSESLDTDFGTAGSIDLSDPASDKVGELVEVINNVADIYALLNEAKLDYEANRINTTSHHGEADATNVITAPDADTKAKAITLANDLRNQLNAHMAFIDSVHTVADTTNPITLGALRVTATWAEIALLANAIRTAYEAHRQLVDTVHAGADSTNTITAEAVNTNYYCEKLFGADATDAADIIDVTLQAKGMYASLWFSSAASGIYMRQYTPDNTDTQRPTYSIQKDGFHDNFLYAGDVVDTLSLSAALKGFVEGECAVIGFSEAIGQGASGLTLEDIDPLVFYKGSFTLGNHTYTFIRNHNLAIANNHNAEGYGQGTPSRQYHQKGFFDITGDCQLRLDADSYAERAKVFDGSLVGISFYYKGKELKTDIPELMLVEIPYCSLREPDWPETNEQIDIKLGFRGNNPKGTLYNKPLTITILTDDPGAY